MATAVLSGWQACVGLQKAALAAVPLLLSVYVAHECKTLLGCTHQPMRKLPPQWIDTVVRFLYCVGLGGVLEGVVEAAASVLVGEGAVQGIRLCLRAVWAMWCASCWSGAERDGRHFSPTVQRLRAWKLFDRYFGSCRIALSAEWRALSAEEVVKWRSTPQFVVGLHPHGSLPIGGVLNGLTVAGGDMGNQCPDKLSPTGMSSCRPEAEDIRIKTPADAELHSRWWPHIQMRGASASFVFWIPIVRELMLWVGLVDCSEPYVKNLLRDGKTVVLCPGGAKESAYGQPGVHRLFLTKHRGFLRVALETGTPVVAAYTFGDEALWWQYQHGKGALYSLRQTIKRASGLMPPTWLHLCPRRVPLTTVVGLPLDLRDLWPARGEPVSEAALDEAMRRYVGTVRSLFDANRNLVPGGPHEEFKDAKLVIE